MPTNIGVILGHKSVGFRYIRCKKPTVWNLKKGGRCTMILLVVLITGFHPILGMTEVAAVKGDEDLQVCSAGGWWFGVFCRRLGS